MVAPYETGCIIKYDFSANPAVNLITPGTHNLAGTDITINTKANGAKYWVLNGTTSYGLDTKGIDVDTKDTVTFEWIGSLASLASYNFLFSKGPWDPWALNHHGLYFVITNGTLRFYRSTTTASDATYWTSTDAFAINTCRHYVVALAGSNPQTAVGTLVVDGVARTFSKSTSAGTAWADDSPYNFTLGASLDPLYFYNGGLFLYRYFNSTALTVAQALQNYNAEKWRYTAQIGNGECTT